MTDEERWINDGTTRTLEEFLADDEARRQYEKIPRCDCWLPIGLSQFDPNTCRECGKLILEAA